MEIKSSMGLFFTDDLDFAQYSNYFAIHGISPWAHAGTEGIALITVDFTRVRRRTPLVIIPRQCMRFPFFCYLYTTFINVMVTIIIVIAVILLIVLWFVGVQRRLVSSDELCRNSKSQKMLSWRGSSGKTASI